ncbi:hypothetical protein BpHYR1_006962 [Brachionus plicatilis]|uniref:Uncharacterized protein n=1 Tax=Brachionus plicatilis TaxID=10195 RepID=A0A3M7P2J9_BRAPC|nr:hypothetical protein BpHYR1_006962 [Brachionus plicatilis]
MFSDVTLNEKPFLLYDSGIEDMDRFFIACFIHPLFFIAMLLMHTSDFFIYLYLEQNLEYLNLNFHLSIFLNNLTQNMNLIKSNTAFVKAFEKKH